MGKSIFKQFAEATEEASREGLRAKIQKLIDEWEPRLGVKVNEWGLRKMKSYWGSCDPIAKKITFDANLATMSPQFLEVTVVHELMHLVTKDGGHNDAFYALMDRHVPSWRRLHNMHAGRMTPQS